MADDAQTTPTKHADKPGFAASLKKLAIPQSATPYLVAAVAAATAMAWYFYIFVPQKQEYFVGLRFRTLAVASGQIKGKAENLGRSLSSAPKTPPTPGKKTASAPEEPKGATADYLRLLVPDLRLVPRDSVERAGMRLFVDKDGPAAVVPWDRVAAQGAAASRQDFDDLVLADKDGHVVWQREQTTPRIGSLKEVLYQPDDKSTLVSSSWGRLPTAAPTMDVQKALPERATIRRVLIGTTSTTLLMQSVRLDSPYIDANQKQLYVAGFISRSRLQQQAMRIPLAWLAVVWLPVAVLFLALPFIKLATMNAKERFSALNLALMAIATIAAAGLGAAIPVGPQTATKASDKVLSDLATALNTRFGEETNRILTLARRVATIPLDAKELKPCEVSDARWQWKAKNLCDLWGALPGYIDTRPDSPLTPELDVAIWLDDRGGQARKLTTKAQLTGPAPHRDLEHFRNLVAGRLWKLPDERGDNSKIPFTIEPLRAPTTAERAVVYGMPLEDLLKCSKEEDTKKEGTKKAKTKAPKKSPQEQIQDEACRLRASAPYLALNVRPHALVDPVMPPGYGFAILAPDGRVLFHSTDGLSLEENFFEEVSDAPGVRERMRADASDTWSGDYHGVPHRIHVMPVSAFTGSHWKIVTFQDLSPVLAAIVDHQSGTFRLSLVNLLALLVLAAVGWAVMRLCGREMRDLLFAAQPDPKRLWALVALFVVVLLLFDWSTAFTQRWANWLYFAFVALPFVTLGICLLARWPRPPQQPGERPKGSEETIAPSRLVRCELAMVIVLVGAIPAAGFARIVHGVQQTKATEQWLAMAHARLLDHTEQSRARAQSTSYLADRREALFKGKAFEGHDPKTAAFSYLNAAGSVFDPLEQTAYDQSPAAGQGIVRTILDWTPLAADRPEETRIEASTDAGRLQIRAGDLSLVARVVPPAADFSLERWLLALVVLGGTIAVAYWAQGRLLSPAAIGRADLRKALKLIGTDGSQGIMLIGPPRQEKDGLVKKAVTAFGQFSPRTDDFEAIYRLRLLDENIDKAFIDGALTAVAAHAQDAAVRDKKGRVWIHVSNLEAQLDTDAKRKAVLELLEKLLKRTDKEAHRVVVVTTSVDPIAHFREIFTKEHEAIQSDDIPEIQLSRSSLLLSRFRRCYIPIGTSALPDPWWDYDPSKWRDTLAWEAAAYPPLVEVQRAVEKTLAGSPTVTREELARVFRSKALAAYDLLWASCTRCEKIVLVQLAQEGFFTTQDYEVVWGLINKGLIVERPTPTPTIFNHTFRQYLRHIEHDNVVAKWERADGDGLWLVAGRLIASSLIAGGVFYLTTQDFSMESLLPVVSGTGVFGVPILQTLAKVTMRGVQSVSA